ncbi:MAG: ribonuclease HI [Anaerolineae bacterium]
MAAQDAPQRVEIYTDGGADPNPGPGGWGAILVSGPHIKEISGAEPATTNNRMELTAAISALRLLRSPCHVDVHTDSQYLRRGITEWLPAWEARGWLKANGAPVENRDLWEALCQAVRKHEIAWHWVRGHSGHSLNERADQLATQARRQMLAEGKPRPRAEKIPPAEVTVPQVGLPEVALFARGCALGVPGPAGYAGVLVREGNEPEVVSGAWPLATSNVMELWAVIAGLRSLRRPTHVVIHTTSKYVYDGATRWLGAWERRGWLTKANEPVANREAWQELTRVMGDHDITWRYLPAEERSGPSQAAAAAARTEAERARDVSRSSR